MTPRKIQGAIYGNILLHVQRLLWNALKQSFLERGVGEGKVEAREEVGRWNKWCEVMRNTFLHQKSSTCKYYSYSVITYIFHYSYQHPMALNPLPMPRPTFANNLDMVREFSLRASRSRRFLSSTVECPNRETFPEPFHITHTKTRTRDSSQMTRLRTRRTGVERNHAVHTFEYLLGGFEVAWNTLSNVYSVVL